MSGHGVGTRIDGLVARYFDGPVPESRDLPWYVAPLPEWLENVGLRLAWLVVVVNLLGTAFGFWYYRVQLFETPLIMWPIVPVSPLATLYMGLSLSAWRLDVDAEWLHALAFFGNLKFGLWTPFVQLVVNGQGSLPLWLWQFLIWSHFAMAIQAFLIHRYSDFPVWAVAVGAGWFALNDLLDYFLTVFDGPHHTWLRAIDTPTGFDRTLQAFDHAAGAAVTLTLLATFLALATRVKLLERREIDTSAG
jgi:uncharacterized membrane protein YpjA